MLHPAVLTASLLIPADAPARQAVERALPPLAAAATGHADQKTCFACHNQAFPMAAFAAVRGKGFALPETLVADQAEHIAAFLDQNREAYRTGKGTGGQVDTAGWLLFTLERAGHKPDDATAAVAEYLLKRDADRGRWRSTSNRPPTEASQFTVNYLAVRGLTAYATADQKDRAAERIAAARLWLTTTMPKDTEDRVYRLLALKAAGADEKLVQAAAKELAAGQRPDGGWGQLRLMPSDAYATGTALVALHEAGGLAVTDPAYRRGVGFLVRTQRADGTWYVKSRSKPFQPYYESGFPYEKDQFIAASASGWATAALALACEPR
jgi:hypothetical protein